MGSTRKERRMNAITKCMYHNSRAQNVQKRLGAKLRSQNLISALERETEWTKFSG